MQFRKGYGTLPVKLEKRCLPLMSELSAPPLIARPGRWAALALGMIAALLAALGLACARDIDFPPPPPKFRGSSNGNSDSG